MATPLHPAQNSLWRLFLTAQVRLVDRIDQRLKQADLPPLEWYDVLFTLKEAPNHRLRLSELAEAVLLSRSNLTRLVDRLEAAGLLQRETCPTDRRGTYAALTPAGLDMQQRIWQVYSQSIAEDFARYLDEAEVAAMTAALSRILAAQAEPRA